MEIVLGERAGKLCLEWIGNNVKLLLWYGKPGKYDVLPNAQIPMFPEELDKLCEWWQKQKTKLT